MPYAERQGIRLYYERRGAGDLELLFVPGWCCDHTVFVPQVEHFAQTCTVTTLDPRGCGRSSAPADGYDIATLADDLAWLCDEVGIEHPVVLGHSLGGMVPVELAARHPQLPRAIVGFDPGPIHPTAATRSIYAGLAEALAGPSGEHARRAFVEAAAGPTLEESLRRHVIETMCAVPLPIATAMIRGVAAWEGYAALALCDVPVLVLLSQPPESNAPARLRDAKPDVQFGMTFGVGHFNHLEAPDQVNPMVDRFLESVVQKSPLFANA